MKKTTTIIILIVILLSFSGALYYLYSKNAEDPVVYETEKPSKQNIVRKTVATGSILPLEEVQIKPNISGVIASRISVSTNPGAMALTVILRVATSLASAFVKAICPPLEAE